MLAENRVSTEVSDAVAHLRMTRGERHNALDIAMFRALAEAAGGLRKEPNVRAVVLSGEGPSFCSGLMGISHTLPRLLPIDAAKEAIRAVKRLYEDAWLEPADQSFRLETQLQRSLIESSQVHSRT